MAEQANIYVKNLFLNEDIEVFREHADGTREPTITIAAGSDETVFLPEPGVFLIIDPPIGMDTRTCWFDVTFNAHLVSWEQMDDHWKMQITDREYDPEVPLDVNVEVGGEPPVP